MRRTLFREITHKGVLLLAATQWFNETRKDEYEKRDKRGREAVYAECTDEEDLYAGEVERCKNPGKGDALQDAAQEPIKKDELECGKDEKYPVEQDTVFGERYAKKLRILAVSDNITAGKILDIAEERRTADPALGDVRGIRNPTKGED